MTLYSSIRKTLVYNDTKNSVPLHDVITASDYIINKARSFSQQICNSKKFYASFTVQVPAAHSGDGQNSACHLIFRNTKEDDKEFDP